MFGFKKEDQAYTDRLLGIIERQNIQLENNKRILFGQAHRLSDFKSLVETLEKALVAKEDIFDKLTASHQRLAVQNKKIAECAQEAVDLLEKRAAILALNA